MTTYRNKGNNLLLYTVYRKNCDHSVFSKEYDCLRRVQESKMIAHIFYIICKILILTYPAILNSTIIAAVFNTFILLLTTVQSVHKVLILTITVLQ